MSKRRLVMDPCAAIHSLYEQAERRLEELAYRAILKGLTSREFLIVCINADDPNWKELVDHFMPNTDWQQFRDKGEIPMAACIVMGPIRDYLMTVLPDLAKALRSAPPEGHVHAVVLGYGGANLYNILPISEKR